jgi:hypothetical protein
VLTYGYSSELGTLRLTLIGVDLASEHSPVRPVRGELAEASPCQRFKLCSSSSQRGDGRPAAAAASLLSQPSSWARCATCRDRAKPHSRHTADATASVQHNRGCLFPVLPPPQQQPQAQQPSSAACRAEPAQPLPGWQPRPTAPRGRLTHTNRAGRQATPGTVLAGRQAVAPVCSRRHSARQHQQGPARHQARETALCDQPVIAMAEAQD